MSSSRNEYETHLTLAEEALPAIQAWAQSRELKWTQIELASGEFSMQPMISFRGDSFTNQQNLAEQVTAKVIQLGGNVVRQKIEAAPENSEVPIEDQDCLQDATYFEHHVKLLLPPHFDLTDLQKIAFYHAARLSRNARRTRSDGQHERFVTQRVFHAGRRTADERLRLLLEALRENAFEILEIEAEFVLEDSCLNLDRGWV